MFELTECDVWARGAMISFLDPRAAPSAPLEDYQLSIDLRSAPVRLGLISNSFIDASAFSRYVGDALTGAVPDLRLSYHQKPDTSAASPELLAAISHECDAIVSTYGH